MSSFSASRVENFLVEALDQLDDEIKKYANNAKMARSLAEFDIKINFLPQTALKIKNSIEISLLALKPFHKIIQDIADGATGVGILGYKKVYQSTWKGLASSQGRLNSSLEEELAQADRLMQARVEYQKARSYERKSEAEKGSLLMGFMFSVFSPLSFVCGIYGMNFVNADGSPVIPELSWYGCTGSNKENFSCRTGITGYQFFYIVCGSILVLPPSP